MLKISVSFSAEDARCSQVLQVKEFMESKPLPAKLKASCISSMCQILGLDVGSHQDATAIVPTVAEPRPPAKTRKGRPGVKIDSANMSKESAESRIIPRMRRRAQSDDSLSFAFLSSAGNKFGRVIELNGMSSRSESDSESGVVSGPNPSHDFTRTCFVRATRSIASSKVASKPGSAAAIPGRDCDVFLASCNGVHIQCKLVCTHFPSIVLKLYYVSFCLHFHTINRAVFLG
jgi:hypothetical protein